MKIDAETSAFHMNREDHECGIHIIIQKRIVISHYHAQQNCKS